MAQLDKLGFDRVFFPKQIEGFIQGQKVFAELRCSQLDVVEVVTHESAAVLTGTLAAGIVDQDAAHGLGRSGEEVPPTVPTIIVFATEQTKIRLVDQGRGLESLTGLLPGKLLGGQAAQFVVYQREKLHGTPWVTLVDRREDPGHFCHGIR